MSRASFRIAYDGPALRDGEMDVRDLAPALLAVGEIFDAANRTLNGESAKTTVQVKATGRGSFDIVFQVIQRLPDQIAHLFSGEAVTAAINLRDLLFGMAGPSLIWLIKRLRGKQPDKVEKISAEHCRVVFDGESFEVPLKLLRLYQDIAIRTAAQKVVADPLKEDGIDTFEIKDDGPTRITVHKREIEYFSRPDVPDEILVDTTRRAAFSIIALAFKEDNKWRLHDGNAQISARIADEEFLKKVDANQIAFSKGDILICDVHVMQKRTIDGLSTEYVVEKVVDHKPGIRQLPFPF